jgi:hypothetical protein
MLPPTRLQVSLYHVNFLLERVTDALRIAGKVLGRMWA